jgi:kumamolisin
MSSSAEVRPVIESEAHPRRVPSDAATPARVAHDERLRAVLVLRSRALPAGHELVRRADPARLPDARPPLTRAEIVELQRPEDAHVAEVESFAREADLRVVEVSPVRHDVVLEGAAARVEAAFGVDLEHFTGAHGGRVRGHRGAVHLPEHLHRTVESVLGLDEVPLARRSAPESAPRSGPRLWPREAAEAYSFPKDARGRGQRIAILSFGGGFHESDLRAYFEQAVPGAAPRVRAVPVLGTPNAPLTPATLARFVADFNAGNGADVLARRYGPDLGPAMATFETTMDVELAAALAPEAAIDVYFAPDTPAGWYVAIQAALDEAGALDPSRVCPGLPTVLSISWGNPEAHWGANRMWALHRALELAAHKGVTVCCASGDFGALGAPPEDGAPALAGVSFPASSPFALACGGTRLRLDTAGAIADEVAWNSIWGGQRMASGGGLSGLFARPSYQRDAELPDADALAGRVWTSRQVAGPARFQGRGVPDVAANADAQSGYHLWIGGRATLGGGTSAATPVWAACVALLAERLGRRPGFLNPLLYLSGFRAALRDVTDGNNDVGAGTAFFQAGHGWDAVTGLGTPRGEALLAALTASQP